MIKEKAYAKINLFLNVVNKREDGYHNLEMVMTPIQLHDVLTFEHTPINEINLVCSKHVVSNKEGNIIYKVATHLKETFSIETGVKITLDKQIPLGAGLGGGSADAAATLRGLNKLWKLDLSIEELSKIGEAFGADIPFCIQNKLAIVKGIGEELMFLDKPLKYPVLLIYPNLELSTKRVFESLKATDIIHHRINKVADAVYNNNYDLLEQSLFNSLEQPAFRLEPTIQKLKENIERWGYQGVLMSGSGSTIFVIGKKKNKLKEIQKIVDDSYLSIITKMK